MKKLEFNDVDKVFTDIKEVLSFISKKDTIGTLPVNWSKYVNIFDLKDQEEPVLIKKDKEVFLLFPPFQVDIDTEKEVSYKKGINKRTQRRICNPSIKVSDYLIIS